MPANLDAAEQLMQRISGELKHLHSSIAQRDLPGIEEHTDKIRAMLAQLRPLLLRHKRHISQPLVELRGAIYRCNNLLRHVRTSVRALISVYRSGDPYGAGF